MNNKTIQHIIASALLAAILLPVSCQREELQAVTPVVTSVVNVHGGEVTVGLSLDIAGEDAGTPEAREYLNASGTKAVDDPDSTSGAATTKINDFYLLQFNGIADTCKLIGVQYFKYDDFISNSNPNGAGKVKLISSTAADAVFVIANTCNPSVLFPYGMTMSALKSKVKSISSQADLLGKGAATGSGTSFPDDRDYHIMMNAQVNATIDTTTSLSLSLKRNVARVKVKINNTTATDDPENPVTIKTLTIRNVPTTSPYITYTTNGQTSLPDIYPTENPVQTFDYPAEPYKTDGNVFYVPVNKRGTNDNTSQNKKGLLAPAYSTYLLVDAEYGTGTVKQPVSYSFYLGANLTDDYNLLPNSTYTYTITMRKKGNPEYDYRVEDWGTVDFTKSSVERANCYILNPAPTGDRQFRIPIDRIRTFWGGEGMTDSTGYEKYEESTNPDQFMNQTFSAFILWTDIENINDKVTVDITDNSGDDAYFTATVAPGTEGNAVVAVQGSLGGEEILWSWHLWITDYKPDEVERYSPEDGRYIYPVRGGAMHRYAGDIWETGIYKNKFIMDRDLGALDTTFVNASTEGKGVLYYQFGRKDPLPGYDGTKTRPAVYYPKSDLADGLKWKVVGASDDGAAFTDPTAMRYSVKYPLAFIKGPIDYWTYGNKYNPTTYNSAICWQDPNVQTDDGKSLFDPCPPGYRVPKGGKNGTWSNFRAATSTNPTTNINGGDNPPRNLPIWSSTSRGGKNQTGLHYYPGTGDVGRTIYYPASGHLSFASGTFDNVGGNALFWSCSPYYASKALSFYFNSDNVSQVSSNSRARGFLVRCVQE